MQQASQRQNALYGTLAGFKPDMPVDAQVAELVRGGHLTEARSLAESHAKSQKDMRDAETAQLTNFATKTKLAGQILAGVTDDASYQRALPKLAAIDPKAAAAMPPAFDPAFVANEVQAGLDLDKQLEQHFITSGSGKQAWSSAVSKYRPGAAATIIPGTIVNQLTTPGEDLSAATIRRGQDITQGTAIRGQDIVAGTAAKALAQAGNLPLQESLAAARERGTLTTKNQVTAQAILPKVIADAETALQGITGMIGSAQVDKTGTISYPQGGTLAHPGFESAVGAGLPGLKYVPGSSAADFNKRFDQVMGGAFLDAYESLRGANAITDIEGAKGTAAKTRMSTAQSEVEFVRAARELESIVRKGIERAKAKAGVVSGGNPHAAKTDAQIKAELGL